MDNLQEEKIKKTVLFEKDLHDKIIEMSKNGVGDFSRLRSVVPPSDFFFSISHIPRHGNLFRRF